jgi:D-alanyl-D-alanine carboxypeptidase
MIETILSIILASRFSTGSNLLVEGEKFITHKNFDTQIIKDDTMIAPIITAKSAIVTDLEGNILFELNSNEQVPMASLTKLMTTYIILEENNLEDIVKVSQKAASEQGSRMGLHTGEEISVKNLLYGAFLNSGNDSATALAEHNAGSVLAFVEKMNQKANELGLYNTNFKNPTGIDQTDHYSSANDIAK